MLSAHVSSPSAVAIIFACPLHAAAAPAVFRLPAILFAEDSDITLPDADAVLCRYAVFHHSDTPVSAALMSAPSFHACVFAFHAFTPAISPVLDERH